MRSPTLSDSIGQTNTSPNTLGIAHAARPAGKPSWRSTLKRLNAIDAQSKAARARGDWQTVHACNADWSFVFRSCR